MKADRRSRTLKAVADYMCGQGKRKAGPLRRKTTQESHDGFSAEKDHVDGPLARQMGNLTEAVAHSCPEVPRQRPPARPDVTK